MDDDQKLLRIIREKNLSPQQEKAAVEEFFGPQDHFYGIFDRRMFGSGIYGSNDFSFLQSWKEDHFCIPSLHTLDELLEKDEQRVKDGFPKRVKIGQVVSQGKDGNKRTVVVPTTSEDKLVHDNRIDELNGEGRSFGGSGEEKEGEVIGREQLKREGQGQGAGSGEGGEHDIESSSFDRGRVLTEKFKLPNLKDKGKKKTCVKYSYDLTDRFRGSGQFLDRRETFKRIIGTNRAVEGFRRKYEPTLPISASEPGENEGETQKVLPGKKKVSSLFGDPTNLIVSPRDKVYRVLSLEKDYESQAIVFFIRDYSGSMIGKPTQVVVTKDVFIHAWLNFQYQKLVKSRFILHDSGAKEVPDFNAYYNLQVAGGTMVSSAFTFLNKIVEEEDLAREYNIYVFYGTDGDDYPGYSDETMKEIEKTLSYANRLGITVVRQSYTGNKDTEVEGYLKRSGFLEAYPQLIRLDVMSEDADEERIIEGIKKLVSEEES